VNAANYTFRVEVGNAVPVACFISPVLQFLAICASGFEAASLAVLAQVPYIPALSP
jgi:hypothetical protein